MTNNEKIAEIQRVLTVCKLRLEEITTDPIDESKRQKRKESLLNGFIAAVEAAIS